MFFFDIALDAADKGNARFDPSIRSSHGENGHDFIRVALLLRTLSTLIARSY
jgi:hypothetical protein